MIVYNLEKMRRVQAFIHNVLGCKLSWYTAVPNRQDAGVKLTKTQHKAIIVGLRILGVIVNQCPGSGIRSGYNAHLRIGCEADDRYLRRVGTLDDAKEDCVAFMTIWTNFKKV